MTNMKRFIRTLFSSMLIPCLLLTGCWGGDDGEETSTPTPIVLETATPEPQPAVGGELLIPMPRNPFRAETTGEDQVTQVTNRPNPLNVTTEEMRNLYLLVYEPLLRCDANNRIVPSLAERWSVDDTGKTWTIVLRENVAWHDGEYLTSDDVIHTMNQIRALGEGSYYYPQLTVVEGFARVDERTLTVTMAETGASTLYALVFPVVCARETEQQMVGTGPYKLEHATDMLVELSVNPRWWRQTPYIQTVRALAKESNEVALSSFEAGQLNLVPTTTVAAGKYREAGITNVLDVMTQDAEVLLVNHSSTILQSLEVRQAIAYAIDRSAIVSNVYMNRAAVSDVPVPPDSFLYEPTSKIYDFNKAQAESLLASAGWEEKDEDGVLLKNGRQLKLRLLVNDSSESTYRRNAADIIAVQLLEVGILVEVELAKLAIGEEGEYEQRLKDGNFDLAMAGFNVDRSGDLSPYLSRSGARNYGRYAPSERMEQCLRSARGAVEEKDMRETHAALQLCFVEELPFITLSFRMSSIIYSAKIQNVTEVRGSDVMRTVYRWYMNTQ